MLLALDKLAEVIPTYRSVHGAFRVVNYGDGLVFESELYSNNTGYKIRIAYVGEGLVSIYTDDETVRMKGPYTNIFLSPSLDFKSALVRRETDRNEILIWSRGITDGVPNDTGFGSAYNPELGFYINYEVRFYTVA